MMDSDDDLPSLESTSPAPTGSEAPNLVETGDGASGSKIRDLLDDLEDSMDDVGKIKSRYMSKILPDDEEFNSSQVPVDTVSKREVQDLIESIPKAMLQKPIQPGASPSDEEDRFLCWNNTGIIRAQFNKDNQNIDVMFYDTEKHSSVNFTNDPNYTFGSLSDDVVILGSNGKYGTGPATLHGVNLLESNREQRDWDVELPHVELIEALCSGSGFVAVVTDKRNLRLFTNGGMQSYLFTLSGQILCMAALDRRLMIIYHNGAGHSDDQNLSMIVFSVDLLANKVRLITKNVPVALSKRSPLAWAGFSDEGTPCTYDYAGVVRMYKYELGQVWVPLADLRELTSSALDHYFVVGVSELSLNIRAVKCRKSRFPDFKTESAENLDFSLPMCEMDTDKGQLEEEYIRLKLAEMSYAKLSQLDNLKSLAQPAGQQNEKLLVNTVLRLFAMYLKMDKEDAARSLIYMIPKDYMSKLPEFAWKLNRRRHFIDSLNEAMEEREQLELMMSSQLKNANIDEDDIISIASGGSASQHSFGKDLEKELGRNRLGAGGISRTANNNNNNNEDDVHLKPISLDKLMMTNNVSSSLVNETKSANKTTPSHLLDDDLSGDENDAKRAKRIKTVNYNLFSKKRPKS